MSKKAKHLRENTSLAQAQNRMDPEIQDAIDLFSDFCMVGLRCQHADDDRRPNRIAYTDGRTVFGCPGYDTQLATPEEKLFVVLHEWSHNGLAHSARARQMFIQYGDAFDSRLWNIATDALINAALAHGLEKDQRYVQQPKDSIDLREILIKIGKWSASDNILDAASMWSAESLYAELVPHRDEFIKDEDERTLIAGELVGLGPGTWKEFEGDIVPGQPGIDEDWALKDNEEEIREWAGLMARVHEAIPALGKALSGELQKTKTPWQTILRQFLMRHAGGHRPSPTHRRGSRRWTSLEHTMWNREGVRLPFEPARKRNGLRHKIAWVIDTSGSVWQERGELLKLALAELATLIGKTSAMTRIIQCDDRVRTVDDVLTPKEVKNLQHFTFAGNGCTSFVPGIEEALKWDPDCILYFTDLGGDFGVKPPCPILWVVPENNAIKDAPFGSVIEIKLPAHSLSGSVA